MYLFRTRFIIFQKILKLLLTYLCGCVKLSLSFFQIIHLISNSLFEKQTIQLIKERKNMMTKYSFPNQQLNIIILLLRPGLEL